MPPKSSGLPLAITIIFTLIYFLFLSGILTGYIIMLRAAWRAMKAHEKIADKLSEIADKLQLR